MHTHITRLSHRPFAWMALPSLLLASTALLCSCSASGSKTSVAIPVGIGGHSRLASSDNALHVSVVRVGMTVSNLDRALEFYSNVLGFTKVSEDEAAGEELANLAGVSGARVRTARLRLGEEVIELTQYVAPEGRLIPADSRSNDRWFQHIAIAVSDMDRAYERLRAYKTRHVSTGPQTLPEYLPNAAGISAFYFKDPDGHVLELIHFPLGKGDPRWALPRSSDALFLGIDHTAIVVACTETSLRFYRDTLGLRVAGESVNYGTEQEHLNNVFGVRLKITTLQSASGPGVELLEYLTPVTGRPYPADSHANDLWHWQTTMESRSLNYAAQRLEQAHAAWVSTGVVSGPNGHSSLMVRDPDGHAVLITNNSRK